MTVTTRTYSTHGRDLGTELEPQGSDSEPLAVEADIAERIADELGADEGKVTRVFYAVVKQSGRKLARRMVVIEASSLGDDGERQAERFLAQRCEPDRDEPWYTVGALRPCAGCGEEMLTLAGSWGTGLTYRRRSTNPERVLEVKAMPTGEVAHAGCGPIGRNRPTR